MSDDTTKPAPTTEPTRRDEHAADELDRNLDGQCPHTGAFRYRVDCGECRRPAFARALAAAREEGRIEERATLGRLPSFNIPISELEEGSEAVPDLSAMFTALAAARREGASEGAAAEHARMVALADLDTIERTMAWAQRLHGAACHLLAALPLPCDIADPKVAAAVEVLRAALTRSQKEKTVT